MLAVVELSGSIAIGVTLFENESSAAMDHAFRLASENMEPGTATAREEEIRQALHVNGFWQEDDWGVQVIFCEKGTRSG